MIKVSLNVFYLSVETIILKEKQKGIICIFIQRCRVKSKNLTKSIWPKIAYLKEKLL